MGNYHDQVGTYGRPDLGFDGIDALPVKRLDAKILFDPFEEQFNLPMTFVVVCDLLGIAVGNIGKQDNVLIVFMVDQYHSQIMINLPRSVCIGIGQSAEWHVGFDSHMITTRAERIEGGSQIPEAIAKSELSEAHTKELIPAREFLCTVISFVLLNYFSKFIFGNNIHKLFKNGSASVHDSIYRSRIKLRRHWQATS